MSRQSGRRPGPISKPYGAICMALTTAARVGDFLSSLGVNTHLNYTDGAYANSANVVADLNYLGVHDIRDATPNPNGGIPYQQDVKALNAVAAAGGKIDFLTTPGLSL